MAIIATKNSPPPPEYAKRVNRKMSFVSEAIAVTTLFMLTGWFYVMPALVAFWLYHIAVHRSVAAGTCLAVLVSSAFWPTRGYSIDFCRHRLFSYWRDYFSFFKYVLEDIETEKNYMWVEYPHAVFPMGTLLGGTYFDESRNNLESSGKGVRGIAASVVFRIPWMRHVYSWIGAVPANEAAFKRAFREVGSCSVLPGGIAEMFMVSEDRERILLRSRYGFVKVALESGASLVPVYHFGRSLRTTHFYY
jgi:1-acyl-sn-glycerol-3-phosphate acyltransferase